MHWFKILLIVLLLSGIFACLRDVHRGSYSKEEKPITNAITALLNLLLIMGILTYL